MNRYAVIGAAFLTIAAILFDLYGFGVRTMPLIATGCAAFGVALILGVMNERKIAKEESDRRRYDRL